MSLCNNRCRRGLTQVTVALLCIGVSPFPPLAHSQPKSTPKSSESNKREIESATPAQSKRLLVESKVIELRLQLEKTPSDQKLLQSLSRYLLRLGQYQEALTHLRTLVELSPKSSKSLYLLAFTLRKLKRYREAIEGYEVFLNLSSGEDRLSGVFGLAKTLDLVGDPKGAIELYQEYIEQEKRPSKERWISEAKGSLSRLRASEVVLIDTDTDEDNVQTDSLSETPTIVRQSTLSQLLAEADQHFAERRYAKAEKIYAELASRETPASMKIQLCYYAAVSAYLVGHFFEAQTFAERGLMIDEKSAMLRGMAVLSHLQHKRSRDAKRLSLKTLLPQVRLSLKEGRFHDCLRSIDQYLESSTKDKGESPPALDPLLMHAKGRALLGLERYGEAYQALSLASEGLNYPHIHLDLAVTASAMHQSQRALKHYQKLRDLTRPQEGQASSHLFRQAERAIEAL